MDSNRVSTLAIVSPDLNKNRKGKQKSRKTPISDTLALAIEPSIFINNPPNLKQPQLWFS